ncbi:hypothetical protein [Escherichia coli]|uniref:hypothetical protein n=1 Tax=Escherichia coli TaxID=562 RepID=UPI00143D0A82|nr:hypothetical protein [Escherichia coli]
MHIQHLAESLSEANAFTLPPRYFIRTPYNGVLASQTRHDYCPQSSMIRGVMSPGLVGRW